MLNNFSFLPHPTPRNNTATNSFEIKLGSYYFVELIPMREIYWVKRSELFFLKKFLNNIFIFSYSWHAILY